MSTVNEFLCPYCQAAGSGPVPVGQNKRNYFACRECEMRIPVEYIESAAVPREVLAAIGSRGHGKTAYLYALYQELNQLARYWPGFYLFPMDERSLDLVNEGVHSLKSGGLPEPTPASSPVITIIRAASIPFWGERVLIIYDIGGEAYSRAELIARDAPFARRTRTALVFMSLEECGYDAASMQELLSVYVQGVSELGGDTRRQQLIIVLSKGDRLKVKLAPRYGKVWDYLTSGTLENVATGLNTYLEGMRLVSGSIRGLIREMGGVQLLNFAGDRFRSVEFCIVSALGAQPGDGRLQVQANPKRVLDPLLWALHYSGPYGQPAMTEEKKHEWFQIFNRRYKKREAGSDRVFWPGP